jgi:tripartite-type tricarboxylate transporter receptor subunit TctC
MTLNRRDFIHASGAALLAGLHGGASAQPAETGRIYVGFPAGTTPDILARKVGEKLVQGGYARALIVENRAGAGGQLGVVGVKGMPADGNHILLTPMSMLGVYPFTYKKLPYDPVADLTPVSMGVSFDYGIAVGPMVPDSVRDIPGLMAWFKANPDKASIASPAPGSTLHFTGVMLGRAAGIELTHVGYKGSPPAIQDMLGGTLPALVSPLGSFLNYMGPGSKIRVLATSGARRSRFTPGVATLAEQGYKDLVFSEWYGFYLPARAPAEVVRRLNAALHQALKAPDIAESLAGFGMDPAPGTPEELATALQRDLKIWGPIVKSIGFTVDS